MFPSGKLTFLESSDDSFNTRQKSVFDQLDKLEKARPENRYSEDEYNNAECKNKKQKVSHNKKTSDYVGRESIFKEPEAPDCSRKSWISRMPDHQVNPHKWTRYTLSDVTDRDISDRGNAAAAMSFLREVGTISEEPIFEQKIKVAPKFIKSAMKVKEPESKKPKPSEHPLFQGSKRTMPEYVVGQKVSKKKEKVKPAETPQNQIKLDHLLEEDD